MRPDFELPQGSLKQAATLGCPQCYAGLSDEGLAMTTTVIEILTVPAARRRLSHQLSVAGIAVGATAVALVTWLAMH